MPTFAFSGGSGTPPKNYGQQDVIDLKYAGVTTPGTTFSLQFTTTSGRMTIGAGFLAGLNATFCFKFKNRVYLAMGSQFNFCDNSQPTVWQQQGPGAGFVAFLSQMGGQDVVQAFSQLQGRLLVFGSNSIQLWSVDADPSQFSMVQAMDNSGTVAPLSVQSIGDYDVLYLDPTGFRSARARELTNNAFVDDVGSAIDTTVQQALQGYDATQVCAIVEPATKNYWCYVNGNLYVYSRRPSSKISAWSTFKCVTQYNEAFVPQKFVVYNNRVYCRSQERFLILYGGARGNQYDQFAQVTMQLPWLDGKAPEMFKQGVAINAVIQGKWNIYVSMNPQQTQWPANPTFSGGDANNPNSLTDSTYDIGFVEYTENGTHYSMKAVSANASTTVPAIFSSFAFHYNRANTP